jgi:serine/threonine-protein kinase
MSKDKPRTHAAEKLAQPAPVAAAAASPGSFAALTALGVASALWSLFLWGELVLARAGGTPFCGFGSDASCSVVWDSPFASAVHRLSGLPIAGWGVVWGLVALALPLVALLRRAEGQPAGALVTAIRVVAAAGLVTVFVMAAVSAVERAFCLGCFLSYVLAAGYAGIALFGWQNVGLPEAPRGVVLAGLATFAAFLALLYPGTHTPRLATLAGQEAVAASGGFGRGTGTGDAERDQALAEFVASLEPPLKQTLADSLLIYRRSQPVSGPAPRLLLGPETAPVRITEWTDVICEHCAGLHETLSRLRQRVPAGSFSVVPRQFPLDGACNPLLEPRGGDAVRCVAAKAEICLESHDGYWDFTGALFANQKGLTAEKVYELAAPYSERRALEACVTSPETQKKLEEDITFASRYDPDGTPIVTLNGRLGTSFAPLLYALVLTGGADDHPAFASLPAPNPSAHLH